MQLLLNLRDLHYRNNLTSLVNVSPAGLHTKKMVSFSNTHFPFRKIILHEPHASLNSKTAGTSTLFAVFQNPYFHYISSKENKPTLMHDIFTKYSSRLD